MNYQTFRFSQQGQDLVFSSYKNRLPEIIYWGKSLPKDEDLESLARNSDLIIPQADLEESSRVSVLPEAGWGFMGTPGVKLRGDSGLSEHTQFIFSNYEFSRDSEKNTLFIKAKLEKNLKIRLELVFSFEWYNDGMLVATTKLINLSEGIVYLDWLSCPVFLLSEEIEKAFCWGGKWTKEFQLEVVDLPKNIFLRENRRGRTSHEIFPAVLLPKKNGVEGNRQLNQTTGEVYGFHLGWSGNHRMLIETLATGQKQLQFGSLDEAGDICLVKGESFTSPKLYACHSVSGANGIRQTFHRHIRNQLEPEPFKNTPRRIHSNSWEAVYFKHELDDLKKLVDAAKECGAERFVLDDGWFYGRNDDTTALGDWEVDFKKYPDDLFPFIDYVTKAGLDFGLWVEPEMVSEDSDLYRQHPDWVLGGGGQSSTVIKGRHQWVLDFSKQEVFDYYYKVISGLIEKYDLKYIKWDHNRVLIQPSNSRKQTEALYIFWKKLKTSYPKVELESCASGGGRIDLGILQSADRFWLSDSNDPVERWRMQYEASMFFPPELLGSHVGPEKCHTSLRVTDLDFRCCVALTGHYGYEFDLTQLSKEEKMQVTKYSQYYKTERHFLHTADMFALNRFESNYSIVLVTSNKERFLLFVGQFESESSCGSRLLKLTGLDEKARYELKPIFLKSENQKGNQFSNHDFSSKGFMLLMGKTLMEQGVRLPISYPQTMYVVEGKII